MPREKAQGGHTGILAPWHSHPTSVLAGHAGSVPCRGTRIRHRHSTNMPACLLGPARVARQPFPWASKRRQTQLLEINRACESKALESVGTPIRLVIDAPLVMCWAKAPRPPPDRDLLGMTRVIPLFHKALSDVTWPTLFPIVKARGVPDTTQPADRLLPLHPPVTAITAARNWRRPNVALSARDVAPVGVRHDGPAHSQRRTDSFPGCSFFVSSDHRSAQN